MSAIDSMVGKTEKAETFIPATPDESQGVRQELARILADPLFQNSKRYPALLRYVVEQSLSGNRELKERILAVEVFGRLPDYDSNADPIVRVTAGEVRKRLAQFYRGSEGVSQYEIDLRSGSYVPEFKKRQLPLGSAITSAKESLDVPPDVTSGPDFPIPRRTVAAAFSFMHLYRWGALLLALGAASLWVSRGVHRPIPADIVQEFWGPILKSSGTPVLCIGDGQSFRLLYPALAGPPSPADQRRRIHDYTTSLADVLVMEEIATLLKRDGKEVRVTSSSEASLDDLRSGAVVLIGTSNNRWTLRLTKGLRFYPDLDSDGSHIFDRQNPMQKDWVLPRSPAAINEDYGLLVRYNSPEFGRPVIIIAGLFPQGSFALAELISSPDRLRELLKNAPPDWYQKNLEAVVKVQVIDDKTGPPTILAVHYW